MNSHLLTLAWSQLWQVTVLVVIVAALVRTVARNRPHLGYVLWLVVLVKCVMPPLFTSASGVFCWLQPVEQAAMRTAVTPLDSAPITGLSHESAELIIPLYPVETMSTGPAESVGVVESTPSLFSPMHVAVLGLSAWAFGAAVSLGLSVWQWQSCLQAARRARVHGNDDLKRYAQDLAQRLGLRRPVRIIVTEGRLGPAVTGIVRPALLMPEGMLTGKTPVELEPILVHELIHIRRGDLWAGLLQTTVLALWWFHPLVRWAVRESMREAERCCDEAVLAELGCKPRDYARSLLGVLQYKMEWAPAPAFPGAGRIGGTAKRLERIMGLGQGCRRRSPWWCWMVMVGVAAVVLPGGAFVVSGEEEKDSNRGCSTPRPQRGEREPERQARPTGKTVPVPQDTPVFQHRARQALPPPFELTQTEQAQVDSVLKKWEEASRKHERVALEFYRFEYKPAFARASNTPIHIDKGEMGFTSSGKWTWRIRGEWVGDEFIEGQRAARMVFDGESIYEFNYREKTVSQFILAEQGILAKAMNEIMARHFRPFLFASDMKDLKNRFFIRLLELPNDKQVCIDVWPRFLEDARYSRRTRMILNTSNMQPVGLMNTLPNGTDRYAYQFTKVEINPTIPVDPFETDIPPDWMTRVEELPGTLLFDPGVNVLEFVFAILEEMVAAEEEERVLQR